MHVCSKLETFTLYCSQNLCTFYYTKTHNLEFNGNAYTYAQNIKHFTEKNCEMLCCSSIIMLIQPNAEHTVQSVTLSCSVGEERSTAHQLLSRACLSLFNTCSFMQLYKINGIELLIYFLV